MSTKNDIDKVMDELDKHKESFRNVFEDLPDDDKFQIYQEFATANSYEYPYYMDSLDDLFCGMSFLDAYAKIDHDNFDPSDNFVWYNGYGYVSGSLSKWLEDRADIDNMVSWLENHDFHCHNENLYSEWLEELDDLKAELEDLEAELDQEYCDEVE